MQDQKPLYNPLNKEFSYEILDDNNQAHTHTIPSYDTAYFDPPVYEIMKTHLKDAIKNDRNVGLYELEVEAQIEKEIKGEL